MEVIGQIHCPDILTRDQFPRPVWQKAELVPELDTRCTCSFTLWLLYQAQAKRGGGGTVTYLDNEVECLSGEKFHGSVLFA
jgi:hypothetical protein